MTDYTSPDTRNYVIGKANVYFTPEGGVRRHMGNCSAGEIEPSVERLDHWSSMEGVRKKDKTVALEVSGVVRLTLDEFTLDNLRLALLGGDETTNTEGNRIFEILATDLIRGRLEVIGSNDVGPKYTWDLPSVAFAPAGPFAAISDEWSTLELEGEIEASNGSYGTIELQDSATE